LEALHFLITNSNGKLNGEISMTADNKNVLSLPPGSTRIESYEQEQALVVWLRTKVKDRRIKFTSAIPVKKMETASSVCEVPEGEHVLAFVDGTTMGSAKECLLVCWSAIYCKWSSVLPPLRLDFTAFKDVELKLEHGGINIMIGSDVYFSPGWADISSVLLLLKSLQEALVHGVSLTEEDIERAPKRGWYFSWIRSLLIGIPFCFFVYFITVMRTGRTDPEYPGLLVITFIAAALFFGFKKRK